MFLKFLKSFHQYDSLLVESIIDGYNVIFEAENINKQFLLRKAGSEESLKEVKNKVNALWNKDQMDNFIKKKDKILNFLYLMEIKQSGSVDSNVMKVLHDLASAGKLSILDKLNSDYTPEQFKQFIEYAERTLKNVGGLTKEEEDIFLRVKVYHDFGDGHKWVVALDEKGEVTGFMPSCVSQKMMSHCGNEPSVQDGDEYFELRFNNKPILTVIINDGLIQESKSFGNVMNVQYENVLPYFKWLLKNEKVKGFGHRYTPAADMGVKDFSGIDDGFIKELEKDKPDLIRESEKKIIDYRRKLKSGELTEQDIIDMFEEYDNESGIRLWELRGILGKIPFNEEEIIEFIKNEKLDDVDIANANHKLLTDKIQEVLIKNGNIEGLIEIYMNVHNNNIKLDKIIEEHPEVIDEFSEEERINIFNKFPESFAKGFQKKPDTIKYFVEDQHDYIKSVIEKLS